jgi:hypothetical protein
MTINTSNAFSYRLIGKLTAFFATSGVQSSSSTSDQFHFRRVAFSHQFKGKLGLSLAKAAVFLINLNLDGSPITSKSHTHPSPVTLANFSFVNLVFIFRCSSSTTNPVIVNKVFFLNSCK